MIEQPEIAGLDRDGLGLPVCAEAEPDQERHRDLMLRAVDHDVVSHDHLVPFVEEGDVVLTRVENVPQSEDAAPNFVETSIRAREPGRAGEVHDDVRAHLPFDGLEIPAHEGTDVLDELSLPAGPGGRSWVGRPSREESASEPFSLESPRR